MLFKKSLSPELRIDIESYLHFNYEPDTAPVSCEAAAETPAFYAPLPDRIPDAAPAMKQAASGGYRKAARRLDAPRKVDKATAPPMYAAGIAEMPDDLDNALDNLDESFQQMLLRKIDESGIRDSVCYKRAGVDRKLFSKIRSNPAYKPKKTTAIAFCMALELSPEESTEMLRKAGYALSRSSKFDVIVEYFLTHRRYDIYELNLALYEYDQPVI